MIYFKFTLFRVVIMLVVFTTLIVFSISVQSRDFKMPYTAKGIATLGADGVERKILNTMSEDELSSFIYEAVHSENPILATTQINVPLPLVSNHVYSITDIDLTHRIVVLRNPWGVNPGVDREPKNKHKGELKLSLEQLQKYFTVVTRSWL